VLLLSHFLFPDGVWECGAVYTFLVWQLVAGSLLLAGKQSQIGCTIHIKTALYESSTISS